MFKLVHTSTENSIDSWYLRISNGSSKQELIKIEKLIFSNQPSMESKLSTTEEFKNCLMLNFFTFTECPWAFGQFHVSGGEMSFPGLY